ncbi:MAG: S-disulfanyl-L-cysteine oxidoreductase SoxD [Betaproteobacteria bacterium]|nr:S-disulfanyl-L-cysteine oxidoreductase SoxD [Betaproteobacteria bacterium]
MSMPRVAFLVLLAASPALAQGPNLGQPISEAEVKAWDISILPDGAGLPPGSGTPAQGARIYAQKCVACHGEAAKGGTAAPLVGGGPLSAINTPKTIANFWGHATTVFDFIRRAMPWQQPRTLNDDEVYALTAYILAENKLIGSSETMNAKTLPQVKMPNRENFILRFPDRL